MRSAKLIYLPSLLFEASAPQLVRCDLGILELASHEACSGKVGRLEPCILELFGGEPYSFEIACFEACFSELVRVGAGTVLHLALMN